MKQTKTMKAAALGIKDDRDLTALMCAVVSDVASGALAPKNAQAIVGGGRVILKAFELRQEFGTPAAEGRKTITF